MEAVKYLLDQEEMDAVNRDRLKLAKLPGGADHMEGLANVCKYVATQMTENGTRLANGRKPAQHPHGCIHEPDPRGPQWRTPYCDNCPVSGLCPLPKEWSK